MDYAVSNADLEQVNMVGTENADIDFGRMSADDLKDVHFKSNVGISSANLFSGNFNNQAVYPGCSRGVDQVFPVENFRNFPIKKPVLPIDMPFQSI